MGLPPLGFLDWSEMTELLQAACGGRWEGRMGFSSFDGPCDFCGSSCLWPDPYGIQNAMSEVLVRSCARRPCVTAAAVALRLSLARSAAPEWWT